MQAVRSATFSIYPIRPGGSEEEAWKHYKIDIDTSCRQIIGLRKDFSSSSVTVANTILFIQLIYILLYCITCTVYFIYNLLYGYITTRILYSCHCITSYIILLFKVLFSCNSSFTVNDFRQNNMGVFNVSPALGCSHRLSPK